MEECNSNDFLYKMKNYAKLKSHNLSLFSHYTTNFNSHYVTSEERTTLNKIVFQSNIKGRVSTSLFIFAQNEDNLFLIYSQLLRDLTGKILFRRWCWAAPHLPHPSIRGIKKSQRRLNQTCNLFPALKPWITLDEHRFP